MQLRNLSIGKTKFLGAAEMRVCLAASDFRQRSALMLLQEPAVDLCQLVNFVDRHAILKCLGEVENPLGVRDREFQSQRFRIDTRFRCRRRTSRSV